MAHNYRFHHGETTIGGLPHVCTKCQIYRHQYQDDNLTEIDFSELITYLQLWTAEDMTALFAYIELGIPPNEHISTPGFQHLIQSQLFMHEMKAQLRITSVTIKDRADGFERIKTSLLDSYTVYEYLDLVARCICS